MPGVVAFRQGDAGGGRGAAAGQGPVDPPPGRARCPMAGNAR